MGSLSIWHWAVLLLVLVILFGSTRLPGAARGLGQSLRIFKSEVKELNSGTEQAAPAAPQAAAPTAQAPAPAAQAVTPAPQPAAPAPVDPQVHQPTANG